MPEPFYAHSVAGEQHPTPQWQLLREHLGSVAELAERRAAATGIPELASHAFAAGWLHDLGKYRESFQDYIRALPLRGRSKQHKEAGAAWAARAKNLPLAFTILGHHGGMPDSDPMKLAVRGPDGGPVVDDVWETAVGECPELNALAIRSWGERSVATDLFTRVLLSCLVDADWEDTAEHQRISAGLPALPTPPPLEPTRRLTSLLAYIGHRAESSRVRNPNLADLRRQILDGCLTAACEAPGLFDLTVPTGGGKTLSGLAFALRHAAKHDLRRVIYVAPYISILDQNADVIREALGVSRDDLTVFEHQSLAEPQQSTAAARRAENWDSPVVLTTNVQFFESLFSNTAGRCRKLHNIARSVVVLDECQTLPPEIVKPTCGMLKQLTERLGCTVVLCTATQPAFDHESLGEHRLAARPIIPPEWPLFDRLKRVHLHWPAGKEERWAWAEVADRMTENASALCIVNTKAAARELFEELKRREEEVFHLSTSMCPAHRTAVLDAVKQRLDAARPVFVVSTQLIEAGVDIDFPCVFREMGPLEAIIQAAGRCNREGRLAGAGGQVYVFRSVEGKTPPGWYKRGREVVEDYFLDQGRQPRIDAPADIRDYFSQLYWTGKLDLRNIVDLRNGLQFRSCADAYRLIGDDTVPVVVASWKEHEGEIERLLDAVRAAPNRANFRALAPFQVNAFRSALLRMPGGLAVPLSETIDLAVWFGRYDESLGLIGESTETALIV